MWMQDISKAGWGLLLGALLVACTSEPPVDIEDDVPEPPTLVRRDVDAVPLRPNVMLLLDKSGSMTEPADPDLPACAGTTPGATCGRVGERLCDEDVCPTRLSRMREAMGAFLQPSPEASFPLRTALALYPHGGQCTGASHPIVDFAVTDGDDEREAVAAEVDTRIQALVSAHTVDFPDDSTGGGTPIAQSLRFLVEALPALHQPAARPSFVLLVTDGLPNCNVDHPLTPDACRCLLGDPTMCLTFGLTTGCLDDVNTVAAIGELAAAGVTTIVAGVGRDLTSPLAAETLQAMGAAGGHVRTCDADAACGEGDVCEAGTCARRYLSSPDGTSLAADLVRLRQELEQLTVCSWSLADAPEEGELLEVKLEGTEIPDEAEGVRQWTLTRATGVLTFEGPACATLQALGEPAARTSLRFTYVGEG